MDAVPLILTSAPSAGLSGTRFWKNPVVVSASLKRPMTVRSSDMLGFADERVLEG